MDSKERISNDETENFLTSFEGEKGKIWTALPCFVESVDLEEQTVTAQPAIQGLLRDPFTGENSLINLPLLEKVPICFPRAGGFALTFPIKQGDECLVIFSSRCIDGWWVSGEISPRLDNRMHDLSDGMAIFWHYKPT